MKASTVPSFQWLRISERGGGVGNTETVIKYVHEVFFDVSM